jgi:hypothetical protein
MTTTDAPRIFDAALVVKALRDSGYKDTYHALAELIDNSIQAAATQVHVYLFSKDVQLQQRVSERIIEIAVLDNGSGMTKEVLTRAIKFGDGTRLNGERGLGKFGMGLPASSISQCQELSVWSWQEGVDNALYTNLSLDAIKKGNVFVPEPIKKAISQNVSDLASRYLQRAGTLVMWENLDRLTPYRFNALSTNLEFVIGRMYRKQIFAGQVEILVHDVHENTERREIKIRANDPLYLMAPTATPRPFDSLPMFVEYKDFPLPERTMSFNGKTGKVKVKVSHIPAGFRKKYQAENRIPAGASDFGKHAAKNLGVSICREGRELKLDAGFADPSDPRDRFWGLEIDFEQELDDLFAVPTNKQDALAVAKFHSWNWRDEALPEETQSSFLDRIKEETPGREQLIKLFDDIDTCLKSIRSSLKIDGASGKSEMEGRGDNAEAIATKVAEDRENAGKVGETFKDELPAPEVLEQVGEEEGIPADAMDHLKDVVLRQNRFGIEIGHNPEAQSFFQVRVSRGLLVVVINSAHLFYSEMWEPMFISDSTSSAISDDEKIKRAEIAFKLTLLAWARLEDETKGPAGEQMRLIRSDWGRLLREFLQDLNDNARPQDVIV